MVEVGKAKGDYVNPADAREDVASIATAWLRAREQVMKPSSYQRSGARGRRTCRLAGVLARSGV